MRNTEEKTEMGNSTGHMDQALHDLFLDCLADVYDAEKQLTKALPKMAKAAQSDELRQVFESHLEETVNHVSRLDQITRSLGAKLKKKTCKAMQGLVEEGSEVIKEWKGSSSLDAALIYAAQKVEHYEIAAYGGLSAWAEEMGHQDELNLLESTLEEEKAADEKLTEIAKSSANVRNE